MKDLIAINFPISKFDKQKMDRWGASRMYLVQIRDHFNKLGRGMVNGHLSSIERHRKPSKWHGEWDELSPLKT